MGNNNGFAEVLTFTLVEGFPEIPTLSSIAYSQDFTASNPVDESGAVSPIMDGVLYDSQGQNITGGDFSSQASNGDYTIDDNGTPRTGTVSISASSYNVGGEFLNLGLVQVGEDANGDATLIIAYDVFGDFFPGDPDGEPPVPAGNESILVTTDFGSVGDLTSFDISPDTVNNASALGVFVHNLVSEPEELVIIDLGFTPSGDFFIQLDSDATGTTVTASADLDTDSFSPIDSSTMGSTITIAAGDLPTDSAFFRVSR